MIEIIPASIISLGFVPFMWMYIKKIRSNIITKMENEDAKEEGREQQPLIKINKKEKIISMVAILLGIIISFITTTCFEEMPGTIILAKQLAMGVGIAAFITISMLDILYGEIYIFELSVTNTCLMFVIPLVFNLVAGCKCIAIGLGITFGIYVVAKVINFFFNKELSIGGADVDTIASLILTNVGIVIALNMREEFPLFAITNYLYNFLNVLIANFVFAFIIHIVRKIVLKKIEAKQTETGTIKDSRQSEDENKESSNEDKVSAYKAEDAGSNVKDETSKVEEISEASNEGKKRKNLDFRCLPAFLFVYAYTLLNLYF